MEARALKAKLAFIETGGKVPANPANLDSDKGSGGSGGGAGGDGAPKLTEKGDKAVMAHFKELREFKASNRR